MSTSELATSYAALILADDDVKVTVSSDAMLRVWTSSDTSQGRQNSDTY